MGNKVCDLYQSQQLVCRPQLRSNVPTTAAVDNIDHNPSSTTAKDSFHGTVISLHQHPSFVDEENDRNLSGLLGTAKGSSRTINRLPGCYTNVPTVADTYKYVEIPVSRIERIERDGVSVHTN